MPVKKLSTGWEYRQHKSALYGISVTEAARPPARSIPLCLATSEHADTPTTARIREIKTCLDAARKAGGKAGVTDRNCMIIEQTMD